jgi:pilus assembly protein FimV
MSASKPPAKQKPGSAKSVKTEPLDTELEPVTASEVRTKLDLARQFLDMGDPDSARHMLAEVLAEGDPAQQQEAQRIIDSMPGARR